MKKYNNSRKAQERRKRALARFPLFNENGKRTADEYANELNILRTFTQTNVVNIRSRCNHV